MARRCEIEGCERKHLATGLCEMHYRRRERTGSIGPAAPTKELTPGVITAYSSAHTKLTRELGRAAEHDCVDCGGAAEEWSFENNRPGTFSWSDNPADYRPRCRPCHRTKDKAGI